MGLAGILAKIEFAFAQQILLASYQIYAREAFYAAFVLTKFCWRGRYKFEAWLNFLLGWRADHYF